MDLPVELISEFVSVTSREKESKNSNMVHGTVVIQNGLPYVQVDGSDSLTPIAKTTDVQNGERVIIVIENHTAIVTGNISSPSASSNRVDALGGQIAEVGILVAGKVSTEELLAESARIDTLTADNVTINEKLVAANAVIASLDTTYAKIEKLNSVEATIKNLDSTYATISSLNAGLADVKKLFANYATIEDLEANYITAGQIEALYVTTDKLKSEYTTTEKLAADYATIASLNAIDGKIGNLNTSVGDIKTLMFGSATGNSIQTSFANAVIATLGNASIDSALIKDLSTHTIAASQITSGDIITDKVTVKSQDGALIISGAKLQIGDGTRTRIQIGKDASNAYSFAIFDANGNTLFYEDGITGNAIPDQIIDNDMVKDDANISASKLDINSLFTVINDDGSNTLKASKLKFDETNQTLEAAFNNLTTKVDGISVGGRNLVKGTSLDKEYSGVINPDIGYRDVWSAKTINIPTGTEYIVSFDAKADEEININCFFFSPNTTLTSESSTGDSRNNVTDGASSVHITTEWKRYWVRWTQTPADTVKNVIVGRHFSTTNCVYIRAVKLEAGNRATDWTPAPEDIDANITTKTEEVRTEYRNLSVTVGKLESTIATQGQKIDLKADGSTVTELSGKYSKLEQAIDGLEVTVGEHTSAIANKADGTTVTELSDKYTALEANLDTFKTTVSNTYTKQTDFDNLSIGGRNMLLNTGRDGTIKHFKANDIITSHVTTYKNVNGELTLNCSATSTPENPQEIFYRFMRPLTSTTQLYGLEPGGTYTFSGKAKVSTTSGTLIDLRARNQDYVGGWRDCSSIVITSSATDEWVYFKTTFDVHENATCCYISIQVYFDGSWSGVVQLKDLKFEKGNKATDWSPAPEDTAADISKAEQTVIEQTSQTLTLYATTTDLKSLESRTANLELSSKSIISTVNSLSAGGRNLISDTSNNWYTFLLSSNSSYPESGSAEGLIWTTDANVNGDKYVVSFDAYSSVEGDKIKCFFYNGSNNTITKVETSTGQITTSKGGDGACEITLTTKPVRYWIKYTNDASTSAMQKWVLVGRRAAGDGSGFVAIRGVKLEEGHIPSSWTPSPKDVDDYSVDYTNSKIEQFANSISLSVTDAALGNEASIELTVNGETATTLLDLKNIRNAFANDETAVNINAGEITFNSNTLLINSDYFTLDKHGRIEATEGVIGCLTMEDSIMYGSFSSRYFGFQEIGNDAAPVLFVGSTSKAPVWYRFGVDYDGNITINSEAASYPTKQIKITSAVMDFYDKESSSKMRLRARASGTGFELYYGVDTDDKPILCGTITSELIDDTYQTSSLILRIHKSGHMGFASETDAGAKYWYELNDFTDRTSYEFDETKDETYNHKFVGTACFTDKTRFHCTATYFSTMAYFGKNNVIGWEDHDGDYTQLIGVSVGSTTTTFNLGGKWDNYHTTLQGDVITIDPYSHVNVTSNMRFSNAKYIYWTMADGSTHKGLVRLSDSDVFECGLASVETLIKGKKLTLDSSNIYLEGGNSVYIKAGVGGYIYLRGTASSGNLYGVRIYQSGDYEYMHPTANNSCYSGTSANRWRNVYTVNVNTTNEVAVTSDERCKENIIPFDEKPVDIYSELFDRLVPTQFTMKDGDERIRYGFIAQHVVSAMAELGMSEEELDVVRHDYWIDEETGARKEQYGLAYGNFIALLVHEVQKLKREIITLKGE